MSTMKTLLFLSLVVSAACAPSLAKVRQAQSARYDGQFAEIWHEVREVVAEHYPAIKRADPATGVLVTEWKLINRKAESQVRGTTSQAGLAHGGEYFQARILVVPGGPPWRIVVQGEGAEHRRDFSMLVPYQRHHDEEPVWVQGRIDKLQLQIYERLSKRFPGGTSVATSAPR